MAAVAESVREAGFAGPVPVLTPAECELVVDHLRYRPRAQLAWHKGMAVVDRLLFDLATRPALLEPVRELLGEDVLLWGASVVARRPGQRHAWHTDIETAAPDKSSVSVWIGLENTSRESGLLMMAGSHRYGKSVQQAQAEDGGADVLSLARDLDPEAAVEQPDVHDGEGLFFDGRAWHGSDNRGGQEDRVALLLQYAAAETEIGIPDPEQLSWPFGFRPERPPVLLVSGQADGTRNWLVQPPPAEVAPREGMAVRPLELPLAYDAAEGIQRHPVFHGATANTSELEVHISVLSPGFCPHSLHAHLHEELVVVLEGEADMWLADGPFPDAVDPERRVPGDVVYLPAYQHHTMRAAGDGPLTFAVLKWWGEPAGSERPLRSFSLSTAGRAPQGEERFVMEPLFDDPTAFLARLHAHLSVLQPGAGYDAHTDEHDVVIVLLSGRIEVNGRPAGPQGILCMPAGEPHDMRNVGHEPARYLVCELHAARRRPAAPADAPAESEVERLARELDTVLTSSSWRLTEPLRRVAAALRARR